MSVGPSLVSCRTEAGQALTSLMIGLRLLERAASCSETAITQAQALKRVTGDVLEGLHHLAANLRPASLERFGLLAALRQHTESFGGQNGLEVAFVTSGLDGARLPPDVEITLYRVAQEALTNVARHAHAQRVEVNLQRHGPHVVLTIQDDGKGFALEEAEQRGRLGLFGMRERAEMLGGSFALESVISAGTTISVQVPLFSA